MSLNTLVVGGAGNVGKGIVTAFNKRGGQTTVIDPKVNISFEDITNTKLRKLLDNHTVVVYCADAGNRDEYEKNKELANRNNKRFQNFSNRIKSLNNDIQVWYVGGSWTKRKPNKNWIVTDKSLNKRLSECNSYEKAKISAERNARKLSKNTKIRFIDWISIVPNLAENFSIPVMVRQAVSLSKISYSPGPFGRPLLETADAGNALIKLIENDDKKKNFKKYLIPGVFTKFELFAKASKNAVEKDSKRKVRLEKIEKTPDFLKTKVESDHLKTLGFKPDQKALLAALEENAKSYLTLIS